MRERSILFARPLVQAILAGRKTQTRRPVQPQPGTDAEPPKATNCPFGVAGDRLWVREKWGYEAQFFDCRAPAAGPFVYAADGVPEQAPFMPWKPSLHMPRSACRLVLAVRSSRAERIQQISSEASAAEGCPDDRADAPLAWFREIWDEYYGARKIGWSANPWVWVVQFEVVSPKPVEAGETTSAALLRDELLNRLNRRVSETSVRPSVEDGA